MSASGPVTVRELLGVLRRWQVRVLAGEANLDQPVTWASAMRARLPAFEGFHGGELALISLPVLRSLRSQVVALSLPGAVRQLAEMGVAAVALGGLPEGQALPPDEAGALDEAKALAGHLGLPLLALPATYLGEVEHDVIAHLMARRAPQSAGAEPSPVEAARLRAGLRAEALDALLTGTYAGEAAMRARAAQLGYDLTLPHAVLWVDLAPHAPVGADALGPRGADPAATHLAEELTAGLGAWARPLAGQVSALLPLARAERGIGEVAERAEALLARALGGTRPGGGEWAAGLGEPSTAPAQVHRSAAEARDAARLGLLVLGPRRLVRPADLGVYRLLLALRDDGSLAPFVERSLAPLLANARNGDALVQTLDAFFACNGNLSEAARRLHLHRNSLIYRLNRARELLGRDLDDPELRLALQLAIKGRRVLEL
ncbi:MAG TPA: helix-turn-helix domain-containing protein [Ktedonobacterales bacterium]|nr:helix-turn-helix domain-containing protein [Ktedonobacterales bacterium]